MRRGSLLLALVVLAGGGCGPGVEEPGHDHRQYAEAWCTHDQKMVLWCGREPRDDGEREELASRVAQCEALPEWDWTDECGDLKWTWNQCFASLTCDEWRARLNFDPHDPPASIADVDPCYPDQLRWEQSGCAQKHAHD